MVPHADIPPHEGAPIVLGRLPHCIKELRCVLTREPTRKTRRHHQRNAIAVYMKKATRLVYRGSSGGRSLNFPLFAMEAYNVKIVNDLRIKFTQ